MPTLTPALLVLLAATVATGCRPSAAPTTPARTPTAAAEPPPPLPPVEEAVVEAPAILPNGMPALPVGPIAVVGDVEIPAAAFREIYDGKVAKYSERDREIPASADRRYRKSIAERLIYHEVLRQAAEADGVTYDPAALAWRETQQKQGIRDWATHLERRGETENSLREMYIAELRERAILEHRGALAVSAAEIEEDYQKIKGNWRSDQPRVRASHILIPWQPVPEGAAIAEDPDAAPPALDPAVVAAALKRADEIHARVTKPGADFAAVARAESTGPSAANGGDIGIFPPGRMVEPFSKTVFAMKVGQISKPVRTKFGFHIIKLTGRWKKGELPKSALEPQIVERLEQRKLHQGRRTLKDELVAQTKIVDNTASMLGPEAARGSERPGSRIEVPFEVGIPECDSTIRDYTICAHQHLPEAERTAVLDALLDTAKAWKQANDAVGRESVRAACLELRRTAKAATTSSGCQWP